MPKLARSPGSGTVARFAALVVSADPKIVETNLERGFSIASDLDAWLPDRWKQAHIARCAAPGISVPPNP